MGGAREISIHALLAESDVKVVEIGVGCLIFLSTLSLRRATQQKCRDGKAHINFYPRSPCGERRPLPPPPKTGICISIHALLAESDVTDAINGCNPDIISIHALLAESDLSALAPEENPTQFLSTLSLRRATTYLSILFQQYLNFYPRSPCGERQRNHLFSRWVCHFYPRSPCGERRRRLWLLAQTASFLSTLSLRRATRNLFAVVDVLPISIHALLAESDR